jgi:acetyl esterase/lipase
MNIGYGPDPNQFIRIHRPDSAEVVAVVVLVHGGFFKQEYNIDNSAIDALIPALISNDLAVCMLEYRRVGGGGGYPFTNDDIISGLNKLSSVRDDLRLGPSVLVGHSAGGTLVLWVCCESNVLKLKAPPIFCIALAPIGDLEEGQRRRLSDNGDAIFKYMGELPKDDPDQASAYKLSSPHNLLPLQVNSFILTFRLF